MLASGICRHHDIFARLLCIGLQRLLGARELLDGALRVGNSGCRAHQNGRVICFGQLIGEHGEVLALLRIRRLQHRHLRGDGVMAGILLVLRGVHTGVVRDGDDQTAVDTGIGCGVERVCRDIQADMLHGGEGSGARKGSAQRGFHRDLFIRRPLCVDLVVFCNGFRDFSGRRTRIARRKPAAGLIKAPCKCFIAKHQFFHFRSPLRFIDI